MARQSQCGICGGPIKPGGGAVREFGGGGRVHAQGCATPRKRSRLSDDLESGDHDLLVPAESATDDQLLAVEAPLFAEAFRK
jgi:hypothetical protein